LENSAAKIYAGTDALNTITIFLMNDTNSQQELLQKLNRETAKIPWHELQRFFAAGKVLVVDASSDLIEIAKAVVEDDSDFINNLLQQKRVAQVSDAQAADWHRDNANVWAVVVAPWVLVQAVANDLGKT